MVPLANLPLVAIGTNGNQRTLNVFCQLLVPAAPLMEVLVIIGRPSGATGITVYCFDSLIFSSTA